MPRSSSGKSHLNSMNISWVRWATATVAASKEKKKTRTAAAAGAKVVLLKQNDGDDVDPLADDNRFPRGNSGNSSGNLLLQVGDREQPNAETAASSPLLVVRLLRATTTTCCTSS